MQLMKFEVTIYTITALLVVTLAGCDSGKNKTTQPASSVTAQAMADAIHTVLESDRTAYARYVVNRLTVQEKVIKATEHWKDEKTLPLPAQMFKLSAELAQEKATGLSYSLLSQWPINKKNAPRTAAEITGLKYIADKPGENFYTEEKLGDKRYFTAIYPDIAVAEACHACHNKHIDSPRTDFKIGDVMGGVVIRFPL